ncbi:MAG TPA: hypothetical protein VEZ15_08675 [Acidimicrobiia bacterium]|nr:hypothetical protein [Acidimicrobiia bacterium]
MTFATAALFEGCERQHLEQIDRGGALTPSAHYILRLRESAW